MAPGNLTSKPSFLQGLDMLADYDYVAIFDADFKPDADFLVSIWLLKKACL